jgi:hypothetical protein
MVDKLKISVFNILQWQYTYINNINVQKKFMYLKERFSTCNCAATVDMIPMMNTITVCGTEGIKYEDGCIMYCDTQSGISLPNYTLQQPRRQPSS